MKQKHFIRMMHKKAKQSVAKCHVCAVALSKKGNVLGMAISTPSINRHNLWSHAEGKLMLRYGRSISTIYISRFSKAGNNSCKIDACPMCKGLADRLGISIVSLTNEGE
jgi:hypothetical protein